MAEVTVEVTPEVAMPVGLTVAEPQAVVTVAGAEAGMVEATTAVRVRRLDVVRHTLKIAGVILIPKNGEAAGMRKNPDPAETSDEH